MPKIPSGDEQALFNDVAAIIEGKFTSALLIFCKNEESLPEVRCLTDLEEGLDLAMFAAQVLTLQRRRQQYPDEFPASEELDEDE